MDFLKQLGALCLVENYFLKKLLQVKFRTFYVRINHSDRQFKMYVYSLSTLDHSKVCLSKLYSRYTSRANALARDLEYNFDRQTLL